MYPWANHLTISLLVAEDERRRRHEPAAMDRVRPAAHLASGIRQVVMQLLRARAAARRESLDPTPPPGSEGRVLPGALIRHLAAGLAMVSRRDTRR